MIKVEHLTKRYNGNLAVDDLSFTIEHGGIYGLLGPNGAGKSTTMNMMTGYLAASGGTVTIDGKDVFSQPLEAKKLIGYLPEQPPVYPDMTVEEYLTFAAELKGVAKGELAEQLGSVMKKTGCDDVAKRLIKNLSKGYRQRVGIAQALLGSPQLIILDEPTVGLDPKQIIEIRELILELGKAHTVILSSHILQEVAAVCDEIFIISHGKLVAHDTPERLGSAVHRKAVLELAVKCGEGEFRETAEGIPGLTVTALKEQDGLLHATLEQESDLREQIFFAFAERRLPIYAMTLTSASLEEIFLELTEKEGEQ